MFNEQRKSHNQIVLTNGWRILLADLGVSARRVFERAGLSEELLRKDNPVISPEQYFAFWRGLESETAAIGINQKPFPLLIVDSISTEGFHPVILAALCCSNLARASQRIADHKRLVAPMTVDIEEDDEKLFAGCRWLDSDLVVPATHLALDLAFHLKIARLGTRKRIVPVAVECPIPLEPIDQYTQFFGTQPKSTGRFGMTFSIQDAYRPFVTANSLVLNLFSNQFSNSYPKPTQSDKATDRVYSVLLESLPAGVNTIQSVCEELATSSRTLQRNLEKEGSTFKSILKQVRLELGTQYITKTKMSYPEIAFLLGYKETSSFFRAFKTWTGSTPDEARKNHNF